MSRGTLATVSVTHHRLFSLLLLFLLPAAAAGCNDDTRTLIVEVRTDLTPGVEFVTVRAALSAPGTSDIIIPAVLGENFTAAVRLAEFDGLMDGNHELVVTAADAAGSVVVSRTVRLDLREDLAVTVALSRSCREISCPASGDAASQTTCVSGRCVDPTCSELAPDLCAPGDCAADVECTMGSACAVGLCVEGGCHYASDDGACGTRQTCSPTLGCIDVGGPIDSGLDAGLDASTDTGPDAVDAAEDAGPFCESEVLLASTAEEGSRGGYGASGFSTMVIVMASSGPNGIGDEDPLRSGYSGVTDFRASNDADFDVVVARFMDGRETRPLIDVTIPALVGGGTAVDVSAPLRDTIITMVRRDVTFFEFTSAAGRTDYDATSQWELWGCAAP